jgi:hypothetical protein
MKGVGQGVGYNKKELNNSAASEYSNLEGARIRSIWVWLAWEGGGGGLLYLQYF